MKLRNYFEELVRTMQTTKITFNKKDKVLDKVYVQGATIRTGLKGNVLDEDVLNDLGDRVIHCIGAVDNSIHIYLKDEEEKE
jgi:hypothetical protein